VVSLAGDRDIRLDRHWRTNQRVPNTVVFYWAKRILEQGFARVRSLTPAEGRAISALFSQPQGSAHQEETASGLPRTTYQTARRRLIVAGWVSERYIPAPLAIGAWSVTVQLLQPFAERRARMIQELRADPRVVVLWASPDTIFSISFKSAPNSGSQDRPLPGDQHEQREHSRMARKVTITPAGGELPIYFDFEECWHKFVGSSLVSHYPRGLPIARPGAKPPPRRELTLLLKRPFESKHDIRSALRFSRLRLPRRQRRLLDEGWVARRYLPALADIPPAGGVRIERVVFFTGLRKKGPHTDQLRESLLVDGRVAPFLFAGDDSRVIAATLSPAPARVLSGRPSVLEILKTYLTDIEVVREPVETLFPVTDHRYDRLIETPA
jgi:hypothetical protein